MLRAPRLRARSNQRVLSCVYEARLRLARRTSYADYLAAEQSSERRHEFIDGVIVVMAGGSDEHNAIAGRFARLLGNRESGSCRYYTPDQRFWIAARDRGRHADGSIICGAPEHPAHDAQATINPTVVVEVLSPSSEGDDDGEKRLDFQSLASLEAYVLVAQDQQRVKTYRRAGAEWFIKSYGEGDSFELPTLSAPIAVRDVYHGILDAAGRSMRADR